MPYLPSMTDRELLAYAYQIADPISTTDLECELRARLEAAQGNVALVDASMRYDLSPNDIATLGEDVIGTVDNTAELLRVLYREGIDTPSKLVRVCSESEAIGQLLNDLESPVDVLNTLLREAQSDDAIIVLDALITFFNTVNTIR